MIEKDMGQWPFDKFVCAGSRAMRRQRDMSRILAHAGAASQGGMRVAAKEARIFWLDRIRLVAEGKLSGGVRRGRRAGGARLNVAWTIERRTRGRADAS
jgi:hypothetical protein